MIFIHVSNYIRLRKREIPSKLLKRIHAFSQRKDPLYLYNKSRGIPTTGMEPVLYTRRYTSSGKTLILYRGLLGELVRACKAENVPYQIIDNRLEFEPAEFPNSIELRDYQKEPVNTMLRRQQTLGKGPAGSGKTEMFLSAACKAGQPTLVLVWQTEQQENFIERAEKYLECEIGGIGGVFSEPRITPFTVGMVQSVRNRIEVVKDLFGCVICDEVQRFAASTLREVVNELPAAYRLGASDDVRRRDGREFLIYATFGPVGWALDFTQGQCDVDITLVPTQFKATKDLRHDILDEMLSDADRNKVILDLTCDLVKQGHKLLIWSDRIFHCEYLKEELTKLGISSGLIVGGKHKKEESRRTKEGLNSGSVSVGIGTSVMEQSFNCPSLSAGIMTCDSADSKMFRFRQMRGRLARPFEGKEKGQLYYLWDRRTYSLSRKARNILRVYSITNAHLLTK